MNKLKLFFKRNFAQSINDNTGGGGDDPLVFPPEACFLSPDSNGNFTKQMIEDKVLEGCTYIVMDAETLNIHYEESPHIVGGWLTYLELRIKGTEFQRITLDFRKVFINCFPNAIDKLLAHRIFSFINCEYVTLKLGKVEGDKYKRALDTNAETNTENTQLYQSGSGTKNLIVEEGDCRGFMGDVGATNVLGPNIDTSPLSKDFYLQPDGRYESKAYEVQSDLYTEFGLTGGLGYNRLLKYDMEDITFKFYNENDILIGEINNAQYFVRYPFVAGTKKLKVNVRAMDGRIENPTNFGHRLVHNPNTGLIIQNTKIYDNHRGGLANLGSNATVDNCQFFNTQAYFDAPRFGVDGGVNSTTYHLNCEDAVSRNLLIKNCSFKDKYHKILLTHNISAVIHNNNFSGYGNSLYIYDLLEGEIFYNDFVGGTLNGGVGTNYSKVKVYENTGSPTIEFTNGAEWYNNNFKDSTLKGKGNVYNNVFTNCNLSNIEFTKEVIDNTFIGNNNTPNYLKPNRYIYSNIFQNCKLNIQHGGVNSAPIILENNTFSDTENLYSIERSYSETPIYFKGCTFDKIRVKHNTVNKGIDWVEGSWHFEDCDIEITNGHFAELNRNSGNSAEPLKIYFKNCNFTGTGVIAKKKGTMQYMCYFDNCTYGVGVTMPTETTNQSIPSLVLVEPRTQYIPEMVANSRVVLSGGNHVIKGVDGMVEIKVPYHNFTLKCRDSRTNTILVDEIVCNIYTHYTGLQPEEIQYLEYSIDGGKYWDKVQTIYLGNADINDGVTPIP